MIYFIFPRKLMTFPNMFEFALLLHDHTLDSKRKYTLCYLTITQKRLSKPYGEYWPPSRFISGLLPSEYSTNLKVYTFFWS